MATFENDPVTAALITDPHHVLRHVRVVAETLEKVIANRVDQGRTGDSVLLLTVRTILDTIDNGCACAKKAREIGVETTPTPEQIENAYVERHLCTIYPFPRRKGTTDEPGGAA